MTTQDAFPRPGDLIGQQCGGSYSITSLLGEGGCGQVYLATSQMMAEKKCAVKVLHPDIARRPEGIARFYGEVYAAGKIEDPGIVDVFDAGRLSDGRMYMMMQYCSGGSLASLLEARGALPLDLVLSLSAGYGQALDAAHEHRITHRDIKPANILLVREAGGLMRAKLADFGIAKLHDDQLAFAMMTGTKKIMGSPGYMAPEQCSGRGAAGVDHRADIYAFSSVLYEMVTGRRPYTGNSMFELINDVIRNAPFPRPKQLRPDLPAEFEEVIMAGLAHKREDRIQSIKEILQRLARVVRNGEGLLSYFAPRLVLNKVTPTDLTISEGIGPAATQWASAYSTIGGPRSSSSGRRLAWLVAGAMVGTGATALVAWKLGGHGNDSSPELENTAPTADVATGAAAIPDARPAASSLAVRPDGGIEDATPSAVHPGSLGIVADAAIDAAPVIAGPDAGVPGALAMAVQDAGMPEAPAKPIKSGKSRRPADKAPAKQQAPLQYGTLHLEVDPWADVAISGQSDTYSTPLTTRLPVGQYRVVLTKGTQKDTVDVTIKPNETTRIQRAW